MIDIMKGNEGMLEKIKDMKKNKKWSQCLDLYNDLISKKVNLTVEETIYLSNCLQKNNKVDKAIKILKNLYIDQINNDVLFEKLMALYRPVKQSDKKERMLLKKIKSNPDNPKLWFQLGDNRVLANKREEAKSYFIKGLEKNHNMEMKGIIDILKSRMKLSKSSDSYYKYIGGRRNYGIIIHEDQGKKYITKITRQDSLAKREELFFKEVTASFPSLKEITPLYIDSFELNRLQYLTVEFIEGKSTSRHHIDPAIKVARVISSLPYSKLNDLYPNLNYKYRLSKKPNTYTFIFCRIHEKKYNKLLFKRTYAMMKRHKYPDKLISLIKELEEIVFTEHIYLYVSPEDNFSLLHGDFNRSNARIMKDNKIKLVDWETFKLGPKGLDVARFMSANRFTYDGVKKKFLNKDHLLEEEKIIFIYGLIFYYLTTYSIKESLEKFDLYFTDAISDLKHTIESFKKTNKYNKVVIKNLLIKKELKNKKIKKLENKNLAKLKSNEKLQKQINMLKKENSEIKSSKSWRLTKPLRLFMEKIKRK